MKMTPADCGGKITVDVIRGKQKALLIIAPPLVGQKVPRNKGAATMYENS